MDIFHLKQMLGLQNTAGAGPAPLHTVPFPLPGESAYPRLEPPSTGIKKDLTGLFSSSTTLGEKAGTLFDLGVQTLGLPQEALTRLATGGQFGLPSEAIGVKDPWQALMANVVLDPLNGAGMLGAAAELAKGRLLGTKLYSSLGTFSEIRKTSKGFSYNSLEDMQRVFQRAKVQPPTTFNGNFYTIDFDKVADPEGLKSALLDAEAQMRVRSLTELQPDGTYKVPDENRVLPRANKAAQPFSSVGSIFGTPNKLSDGLHSTVSILDDSNAAFNRYMNAVNDRLYGKEGILTGSPIAMKPNSPLGRAFVYQLRGAKDLWEKDPEAAQAIAEFGKSRFYSMVSSTKALMKEPLTSIPNIKVPNPKDPKSEVFLEELIKEAAAKGTSIPLTPEIISSMGGHNEINPNTANAQDLLQFFFHFVGKRGIKDTAVDAIHKLVGGIKDERGFLRGRYAEDGTRVKFKETLANLSDQEYNYIQSLTNLFLGEPSNLDKELIENLKKDSWKDWFRQLSFNHETIAKAKAGESIQSQPGVSGFVGRQVETLLGKAEKGHYIAQEAATAGRNVLYGGTLGLNLGSAFKNLFQLMNSVVEVGLPQVLQGTGAYLTNPEIREWMKAEGIIGRSTGKMGEMYENLPWGKRSSFMDFLMTPFQAAENLTRGATFIAMMNDLKDKMSLGDAIKKSAEATKNLMFGYSLTDISPYVRHPAARPFFQFMTYPLKQSELLLDMLKGRPVAKGLSESVGPKSLLDMEGWKDVAKNPMANKFVKYLVYTGAAVMYGEHLGVNIENAFLGGLFPSTAGQAPMLEVAGKAKDLAMDFFKDTFTNDPEYLQKSPALFWKGLGEVLRATVPAGTYLGKVAKNVVESDVMDLVWKQAFDKPFDLRGRMTDPIFQKLMDTMNVHPDPGIDPADRLARLAGFVSVHETNRKEFMQFLQDYTRQHRRSIEQINNAYALGGDWEDVQAQEIDRFHKHFGPKLARWMGGNDYVIYDALKPTLTPESASKRREELQQSNIERLKKPLPKSIRGLIDTGGF